MNGPLPVSPSAPPGQWPHKLRLTCGSDGRGLRGKHGLLWRDSEHGVDTSGERRVCAHGNVDVAMAARAAI